MHELPWWEHPPKIRLLARKPGPLETQGCQIVQVAEWQAEEVPLSRACLCRMSLFAAMLLGQGAPSLQPHPLRLPWRTQKYANRIMMAVKLTSMARSASPRKSCPDGRLRRDSRAWGNRKKIQHSPDVLHLSTGLLPFLGILLHKHQRTRGDEDGRMVYVTRPSVVSP